MRKMAANARSAEHGQVLAGIIVLMLVLLIMVPAMVKWVQQESRASVKSNNTTVAFNLAQAAVNRGMWKLKSSTTTWASAANGVVIAGYNFDTTYSDIVGGQYRVKFSNPTGLMVTVTGEGHDTLSKETRAISAVYKNQTIYSPLMAQGMVKWGEDLGVFWGPIMSQSNILLCDDSSVNHWAFPRKYARGTVEAWNCPGGDCVAACPMSTLYPRDTNGPIPPNTDSNEWWSLYDSMPEMPILDFAALRSSAAATGTLNVFGCVGSGVYHHMNALGDWVTDPAWDGRNTCSSSGAHSTHFGAPINNSSGTAHQPNASYVWYWDQGYDVTLSGANNNNQGCGLRGTFIINGNLTIDTYGQYNYTGPVPANAWQEHQMILKNADGTFTLDSGGTREYPADTGFHTNAATFRFGADSWVQAGSAASVTTTVGVRGFVYVGGDLSIKTNMDFNGAVWVKGNIHASGGTLTNYCGIFFDDTITLPTLNVILVLQSWQEVKPSSQVWN